MKSVSCAASALVLVVGFLVACGKSQNESERSFAEACVKMRGGNSVYKKRCECEASIVVPKLTPGELKAYIATQDIQGKSLTGESAATHGFTFEDFSNLGTKLYEANGEIGKACAGK